MAHLPVSVMRYSIAAVGIAVVTKAVDGGHHLCPGEDEAPRSRHHGHTEDKRDKRYSLVKQTANEQSAAFH